MQQRGPAVLSGYPFRLARNFEANKYRQFRLRTCEDNQILGLAQFLPQ